MEFSLCNSCIDVQVSDQHTPGAIGIMTRVLKIKETGGCYRESLAL